MEESLTSKSTEFAESRRQVEVKTGYRFSGGQRNRIGGRRVNAPRRERSLSNLLCCFREIGPSSPNSEIAETARTEVQPQLTSESTRTKSRIEFHSRGQASVVSNGKTRQREPTETREVEAQRTETTTRVMRESATVKTGIDRTSEPREVGWDGREGGARDSVSLNYGPPGMERKRGIEFHRGHGDRDMRVEQGVQKVETDTDSETELDVASDSDSEREFHDARDYFTDGSEEEGVAGGTHPGEQGTGPAVERERETGKSILQKCGCGSCTLRNVVRRVGKQGVPYRNGDVCERRRGVEGRAVRFVVDEGVELGSVARRRLREMFLTDFVYDGME